MTDQISKWIKWISRPSKSTEKPPSDDNWQDVVTECFTKGAGFSSTGRSFMCNSRQCSDIADYLLETTPFRQRAWADEGRIRVLQCDHAIMQFCRAILEAKLFLQDCSTAADFWKNAYSSLTKLHTEEAYQVLLHNLIWSKAGLDVAILYALPSNIDYNKEIKKRVEECKRELFRYRMDSMKPRLNIDRDEFYRSLENPQIPDESQKKCLSFLVRKSKAYELLLQSESAGDGGRPAQHLDVFEIDPHDMDGGEKHFLEAGGYGYVYRRSWLGQTVAVKVLKGVSRELFKKEASEVSLLAGLQNPFIVHMVGWCTEQNGDCILVMELAPTDLKKMIHEQPISVPAAVDIMLQISKGMEYLHKKKIIHRDLKPNNVLLEPSSVKEMAAQGYARVKLCDFGLAKVKERSAADRSMYTTLKAGTAYYRAPEVLFEDDDAHKNKYTRKVDVFSFGITCSEILVGKIGPTCYENLTTKKMREKMEANVRPNLPLDCPSHLARLITSCWDRDHNSRPEFSRVSNTLTYIKFILMRVSDVQRLPYDSVVTQFDEEELKRRVSVDEEFVEAGGRRSGRSVEENSNFNVQEENYSREFVEDQTLVEDSAGPPRSSGSLIMKSGQSLKTNEWIMSNGYKFVMQEGGMLVLYPPPQDGAKAVWASNTEYRKEACTCVLEEDGNLVMYDSENHVVWSSNSGRTKAAYELELMENGRGAVIRGVELGNIWATDESVERPSMRSGQFLVTHQWMLCKGYKLIMQGDSNLVLRSPSDDVLWASSTVHPGEGRYICMLQDDGNLVICDSKWREDNAVGRSSCKENQVVWSSNSSSTVGAFYKLDVEGGRAVIRGPQGEIWATDETVDRATMKSGQFLAAPHWMLCNGYKLIMHGDGNLVLNSPSRITLWASASGTRGREGCRCTLRNDGNLFISDRNGALVWHSDTATSAEGAHTLQLHSDGRLSITNRNGVAIWTAPILA